MIRSKRSSVRLMDSQTWTYQQVNGEKIINTGYANLDCLKLNILSIYPMCNEGFGIRGQLLCDIKLANVLRCYGIFLLWWELWT